MNNFETVISGVIGIAVGIAIVVLIDYLLTKKKRKMANENVVLTFFTGKDGRVIARAENGKICLPDVEYCKAQNIVIVSGEDWRCAVSSEKEKCCIVQPITKTLTAEENELVTQRKAQRLQKKYSPKGNGANGGYKDKGDKKGRQDDRRTSNRS